MKQYKQNSDFHFKYESFYGSILKYQSISVNKFKLNQVSSDADTSHFWTTLENLKDLDLTSDFKVSQKCELVLTK